MRRYAIYVAPPEGSPLACFAAAWLGRDAVTGEPVAQPVVAGLAPDRLAAITASPRHYGFHATLKAPFFPSRGTSREDVHHAARDLALGLPSLTVPLRLGSLGGFLALVPAAPSPALRALADAAVERLDHLRAPLGEEDLARRRRGGLTPIEDAYLVRFGYPYVRELFRYHMTLTDRLAGPEHGSVRAILEPLVAPLCREPFEIEALAVFEQPDRASPFTVTGRYPLGGRPETPAP